MIILRQHILFLASYNLNHSVNYFVMLTLVLWQHVMFLCVSRALFRMSLVMVMHRMHSIQCKTIFIKRKTVIQ